MTSFLGSAVSAGNLHSHLAGIEKLTNGFTVRYEKAQITKVKPKTLGSLGFDATTQEFLNKGLEALKEAHRGEEWRAADAEPAAPPPTDRWTLVSMAIACRNEEELIATIRDAIKARFEIERLIMDGELY